MQSTVSVLMAAIVFIVEFFSGILSSASDREPAKPYKPDKPAVSSTLTVFSRNDEFSDLVGKYQPEGARLNFVSEHIDFEDYDDVLEYGWGNLQIPGQRTADERYRDIRSGGLRAVQLQH